MPDSLDFEVEQAKARRAARMSAADQPPQSGNLGSVDDMGYPLDETPQQADPIQTEVEQAKLRREQRWQLNAGPSELPQFQERARLAVPLNPTYGNLSPGTQLISGGSTQYALGMQPGHAVSDPRGLLAPDQRVNRPEVPVEYAQRSPTPTTPPDAVTIAAMKAADWVPDPNVRAPSLNPGVPLAPRPENRISDPRQVFGLPHDPTPEELQQSAMSRAKELAASGGRPEDYVARVGSVALLALTSSLDSLIQKYKDIADYAIDRTGGYTAPNVKPFTALSDAAVGTDTMEGIEAQAMHANTVEEFVGSLAGIPASLLEPQAIAAMVIAKYPTALATENPLANHLFSRMEERLGPSFTNIVRAGVHSSVGLGSFMGSQAVVEGKPINEVFDAAAHGAISGIPFGIPGMLKGGLAGLGKPDAGEPGGNWKPDASAAREALGAFSEGRNTRQAVDAGEGRFMQRDEAAQPAPTRQKETSNAGQQAQEGHEEGLLSTPKADGAGGVMPPARTVDRPDLDTMTNEELAAEADRLGVRAAKSRPTTIGRIRQAWGAEDALNDIRSRQAQGEADTNRPKIPSGGLLPEYAEGGGAAGEATGQDATGRERAGLEPTQRPVAPSGDAGVVAPVAAAPNHPELSKMTDSELVSEAIGRGIKLPQTFIGRPLNPTARKMVEERVEQARSVGASPAPVGGPGGAGGVAGINAGGVPSAGKPSGVVTGEMGRPGGAGVRGGAVVPEPKTVVGAPDVTTKVRPAGQPNPQDAGTTRGGTGERGVEGASHVKIPRSLQQREPTIRAAFTAKGEGHKRFADRLDRMVDEGTMNGASADLLMATPHLLGANDDTMRRVVIASARFTRAGGLTPSGRTYDPETGKGLARGKSTNARIELQKAAEQILRDTGKAGKDLDLQPAIVMLEEWSHAMSGLVLNETQRKTLRTEYDSKTREEWSDDFMKGLANGNRAAADYASGAEKNANGEYVMGEVEAFEEWLAHKAIEHMLGHESDNVIHRTIMDKVLAAFKAALEHIRTTMGGVPEHLRPLFDVMLHGERQAPEPPQKATRPRSPRQPSPEGLIERGTSAKEPAETRVPEKKTPVEAPKQPVQAAVEPSGESGHNSGQSGLSEVRPLTQPTERPAAVQRETATKPQPAPMTRVEPGRATTLELPNGRSVQVQYQMVEASELTPSHDARSMFQKNPAGDENERPYEDREQGAPSRLQVTKIAEVPKPHLILTDTPVATDGPPIVDHRGVVLGGNARTMALQLAYDQIPSSAKVYRNAMIEAAPRFGIDPARAAQFQQPMIVRAMSQEDAGAPGEMSRILNQSMTAGRTSSADAISRGKKIDAPTASLITKAIEDRSLAEALNSDRTAMQIVRAMTEAGAWDDKDTSLYVEGGSLNAEGKKVIERTLLGSIVPDIAALSELKPETRQLLIRSAGPMIRLRKAMSKDDSDMDFDKTLSGAVEVMAKRRSGGYDSVDELMAESLNGDGALSDPRAVAMARAMENNKPTQFADLMNRTADAVVEAQAGQVSMALGRAPSAGEAFDSALSGGGGGLFGRGLFGNEEKEPPSMLRLQRVEHASGEPGFQMVDERTGQPVSRIYRDYDIARREMAALNAVRKEAAKNGDQVWRDTSEFGQEFKQSEKDRTREVSKDKETGTLFGRAIDQSNQDELGFYSRLGAWVGEKMRGPMQADQLRKAIANAGLPADEIKWTGLDDWLAKRSGAVRPEEVRKYLDENRVVLKEVVKGAGTLDPQHASEMAEAVRVYDTAKQKAKRIVERFDANGYENFEDAARYNTGLTDAAAYETFERPYGEDAREKFLRAGAFDAFTELRVAAERLDQLNRAERSARGATRFEQYTLPGGDHYREVLLTLPPKQASDKERAARLEELAALDEMRSDDMTPAQRARHSELTSTEGDAPSLAQSELQQVFQSSHFSEPNIIAHMRIKDRVTPDGRKVMFLEEVQSDLHEAGRDRGYKGDWTPADDRRWKEIQAKVKDTGRRSLTDQEKIDLAALEPRWDAHTDARRIPQFPWSKTWHEMAFRRALRLASQGGYDALGWTTGATQNERYDLGQQIDSIAWGHQATSLHRQITLTKDDGTKFRLGVDQSGTVVDATQFHTDAQGRPLAEVVGQAMARRIMDEPRGTLSGVDLQVGGEGMRNFYDRDLPNYARRYGKKWGVQPEMGKVITDEEQHALDDDGNRVAVGMGSVRQTADSWQIPITPEMTKSVAEEGQPLFGRAFHASPYTFDKFDTDKIGTGEGAQSYGYGLYFAGGKAVSQWYFDRFSRMTIGGSDSVHFNLNDKAHDLIRTIVDGKSQGARTRAKNELRAAAQDAIDTTEAWAAQWRKKIADAEDANKARTWTESGSRQKWDADRQEHVDGVKTWYSNDGYEINYWPNKDRYVIWGPHVQNGQVKTLETAKVMAETLPHDAEYNLNAAEQRIAKSRQIIDAINNNKIERNQARMYEVELAPKEDEYLLWDRPLNEQSDKVQAALRGAGIKIDNTTDAKGGQFYQYLGSTGIGDPNATPSERSHYLRSLGIRGIKYLAGVSRSPTPVEKRIDSLLMKHGNEVEPALDEFMRGVHNTPAEKAKIHDDMRKDFESRSRNEHYNYVVFSDDDVEIKARYGRTLFDQGDEDKPSTPAPESSLFAGSGPSEFIRGAKPGEGRRSPTKPDETRQSPTGFSLSGGGGTGSMFSPEAAKQRDADEFDRHMSEMDAENKRRDKFIRDRIGPEGGEVPGSSGRVIISRNPDKDSAEKYPWRVTYFTKTPSGKEVPAGHDVAKVLDDPETRGAYPPGAIQVAAQYAKFPKEVFGDELTGEAAGKPQVSRTDASKPQTSRDSGTNPNPEPSAPVASPHDTPSSSPGRAASESTALPGDQMGLLGDRFTIPARGSQGSMWDVRPTLESEEARRSKELDQQRTQESVKDRETGGLFDSPAQAATVRDAIEEVQAADIPEATKADITERIVENKDDAPVVEAIKEEAKALPNREPWQDTKAEHNARLSPAARRVFGDFQHRNFVLNALIEGRPVPPHVIAEYPGIQAKADEEKVRLAGIEKDQAAKVEKYAEQERQRKGEADRAYQAGVDANIEAANRGEAFRRDELWKIPRSKYVTYKRGGAKQLQEGEHRESVENALAAGKPVPPEVLADYPDLKAKAPKPAPGSLSGENSQGQRRAGPGGEYGPNGEFYPAGSFINTVPENEKGIGGKSGSKTGTTGDAKRWTAEDAQPLARAIGHPNNQTIIGDIRDAINGKGPWTLMQYLTRQVGSKEADEALTKVRAELDSKQDVDVPSATPEPASQPQNADSGVSRRNDATAEAPPIDVPAVLKSAGVIVEKGTSKNGKPVWNVSGKTYDIKDTIKQLGGRWWNPTKSWSFWDDPSDKLAQALSKRGVGPDATRPATGRDGAEDVALKQARDRELNRPDERPTGDDAAGSVQRSTADLIRLGAKVGIPAEVLDSQIEDIGMIRKAYESDKPMFVVGSAPGSGKTYVIAGTIRELRDAGAKRFIWVTMNKTLIEQIKNDVGAYGLDGVEFLTYTQLQGKPGKDEDTGETVAPANVDTTGAVLIFDEAHKAKNVGESMTAGTAAKMMEQSDFTLFSTATPFENPVEAAYLDPTGIFRSVGGHTQWAVLFGANTKTIKVADGRSGYREVEIPVWNGGKEASILARGAKRWLEKQGMYSQRGLNLPPGMVKASFEKYEAEPKFVDLYNKIQSAYDNAEREWKDESGNSRDPKTSSIIAMHRVNATKRILEAAKTESVIKRAKEIQAEGKKVVIFVETKADRELGRFRETGAKQSAERNSYPAIRDRMEEYYRERDAMRAAGDYGYIRRPYSEAIVSIARHMWEAGLDEASLPSVTDDIMRAIPDAHLFTGEVSDAEARRNLAAWRKTKTGVILATMAKGGTGLSLHDKIGEYPTAMLVLNMPWTATQLEQVSGRINRYGLASVAENYLLFASNIPFEQQLARRIGGRMRSMNATVKGIGSKAADALEGFDFESGFGAQHMLLSAEQIKHDAASGDSVPERNIDTFEQAAAMDKTRNQSPDKEMDFFATPYVLSALMAKAAAPRGITLEPSVGEGNLLRFLPEGTKVVGIEPHSGRQAKAQGVADVGNLAATFQGGRFEDHQAPEGGYDAVIMNPPFSRVKGEGWQDITHVRKAFDMLAPNGRLVAVMSEGPFFREDNQSREFRYWLEDHGATMIRLPEGAFKDSGTGVRARIVVIDKQGGGNGVLTLDSLDAGDVRDISDSIPIRDGDAPRYGRAIDQAETREDWFKRWFKGSKVVGEKGEPKVMYHGTPTPGFETFDPARVKPDARLGAGFYFTSDTTYAGQYAEERAGAGSSAVMPVFIRMKNPADLRTPKTARAFLNRAAAVLAREGFGNAPMIREAIKPGSDSPMAAQFSADPAGFARRAIGTGQMARVARAAGFDGILAIDTQRGAAEPAEVAIAFDPKQIKSVNAQRFDPKSENITHGRDLPEIPEWANTPEPDPLAAKAEEIARAAKEQARSLPRPPGEATTPESMVNLATIAATRSVLTGKNSATEISKTVKDVLRERGAKPSRIDEAKIHAIARRIARSSGDAAAMEKAVQAEYDRLGVERASSPTPTPKPSPSRPAASQEPSREAVPNNGKDMTLTSARNAWMNDQLESLGLDTLDSPARRTWATALDEAKSSGLGDKAMETAARINENPVALDDKQTAGLVIKASEIKKEHRTISKQLLAATDPGVKQGLAEELRRREQDFTTIATALRLAGTESGRSLAARKLTIDQDLDLVSVLTRAEVKKGSPLTTVERARIEELTTKLEAAERENERLQSMKVDQAAERAVRESGRRPVQAMTIESKKAKIASLAETARQLLRQGCL